MKKDEHKNVPDTKTLVSLSKNDHLANLRHSLAHLLAAAVLEFWPDAQNTIGPAVDNGFYYDFEFATPISDKDLGKIEKRMREILKSWKKFEHVELSEPEARKHFAKNPYKLNLIDGIVLRGEKITLYTCGAMDPKSPEAQNGARSHAFTDLCRGGHIENPSKDIDPQSFKLTHIAGAYWQGSEKNKMLTRIYGLAFESKAELDEYEARIKEAKNRDHKKLGKELDLFTFSELVGSGLPLWTPKGTVLRDVLDNFVWQLRKQYGYERVDIPHITKKELYEKSGHWQKFKDELFHIKTREGHEFVMKPMNCPHHVQIFDRKIWSYREMPQRYASTTKVYRDEQSGELSGLSRVRCITQDDAHVFCRRSQAKDEMSKIWEIIQVFYGTVGFKLTPRLSMHDPAHMEKYLGDESIWQKAENELRDLVKEKGATATEAPGEAAFYGPKIDFMAKDSLDREWQVATIQLDMNMPERFELDCTNEEGIRERIVMVHAAIMGSIERYLSVLIEHFAGAFPLWLSPVQVKVVPVSEDQFDIATQVADSILAKDIRAEADLGNEGFGKKIRGAKNDKIPYTIIIGAKEVSENKLTLESRDNGKVGELSLEQIISKLVEENSKRSIK